MTEQGTSYAFGGCRDSNNGYPSTYVQGGLVSTACLIILKTGCSFTSKITKSIDIQRFLPGQKSSSYPFPVYSCKLSPFRAGLLTAVLHLVYFYNKLIYKNYSYLETQLV